VKLVYKEHCIEVPLDYANPNGHKLDCFARVVYATGAEDFPVLLYLQGGPGYQAMRDVSEYSFIKAALKHYRVVLIDQRGTGRSSKVGVETAQAMPEAKVLAEYLTHFRADNIVRDCEVLRTQVFGGQKWTLLGHSYGGFIITHYLCAAPEGLTAAINVAGVPPLAHHTPQAVCEKLIDAMDVRSGAFYQKHPKDNARVAHIVELLQAKPYVFADGSTLTPDRFLSVGKMLGYKKGVTQLHWLLEDPYTDRTQTALSLDFASRVMAALSPYHTHPIYAVLHESIYCHGVASEWSSDKVVSFLEKSFLPSSSGASPSGLTRGPIQKSALGAQAGAHSKQSSRKAGFHAFHGERIRRAQFDECPYLKPFKAAADILAAKTDWPVLYDADKLKVNKVPVAATWLDSDVFVLPSFVVETADAIGHCTLWRNKRYEHCAIKTHGKKVFEALRALL
jgi:pimeloyl-ACP methyl ester carboxylesterase